MKHRLSKLKRFGQAISLCLAIILPAGTPDLATPAASVTYLPTILRAPTVDWSMPGANPQRTSWTPEEVRGKLTPVWYRMLEPYVLPRVQVIAAYGRLYIATAKGLYTFDAATGATQWTYPTALPLGHSPTVADGIVYVGGFDHKLHAINAHSGQGMWTFEAGAGFDTNPLVAEGKVYAGNRDGTFYALLADGPNAGTLAWKYQTDGPIHYSAAYANSVVFFASDDGYAYALDANSGALKWKSARLPGAGFHSWWPVIYQDWVIFSGSHNYRTGSRPGPGELQIITRDEVFPNHQLDPNGTLVGPLGAQPGDWAAGTLTIDTSTPTMTANGSTLPITEYLERYPWRRTVFILQQSDGSEYTSDFDQDGKPEYAPSLFFGAKGSGTRFPPVIGPDGVSYMLNIYMSAGIPGGHITGWKPGSASISVITSDWGASDEPHAYSAGGNLIYWKLCCDRQLGAIDIATPNNSFPESSDSQREWEYFAYNLPQQIPGYNAMTHLWEPYSKPYGGVYGGRNGIYGWHGDESPPVPYQGKVYTIQSNALVAFASHTGSPVQLPLVPSIEPPAATGPAPSQDLFRLRLAAEVGKIIDAGHLRPAYLSSGLIGPRSNKCGDNLLDYWQHPGDIHTTLLRALPYLAPELQQKTREYLQSEFSAYPPYQYHHVGWQNSAAREQYELPPEVEADMAGYPPKMTITNFEGWTFAPHSFYALWKYALAFGGAQTIFEASQTRLVSPPSDAYLQEMPHVNNAFIAGYLGFLELEAMAGYPESGNIRAELNRLLALRTATFSKDAPESYFSDPSKVYCRAYNVSRNFMYLTPELAAHLRATALPQVQAALDEYQRVAPYWFVPRIEAAFAEAVNVPLYDYHALFQAKAMILQEPQAELARYIEAPAVAVGDLFFIDNLVAVLEAAGGSADGTYIQPKVLDTPGHRWTPARRVR